jgi:S1-C subfamily serine protease
LFAVLRPSVVRIEHLEGGIATGFFVDESGLVLTTAHVIIDTEPGDWRIKMASGETASATVHKVDAERDLAILKTQPIEPVVPLSLTPKFVAIWEQVITLGHSREADWRAVVGTVSQIGVVPASESMRNIIVVQMRVFPGFSGAPVVDSRGDLVGVVQGSSQDEETTYLIPASDVLATLA